MSEFFATNGPDPPHSTLNSYFGAFCTIWEHLGPFCFLMKLGSKQTELCNQCKTSCHEIVLKSFATNTPDRPHWTLNSCFGAFHMYRTSAKVRATKLSRSFFATNAPNPPYWTINSCFGAFRTILVHLRPFGCLAKLGAKRSDLVQKFMPRSRVGFFS